jgi:hypothetical protein
LGGSIARDLSKGFVEVVVVGSRVVIVEGFEGGVVGFEGFV